MKAEQNPGTAPQCDPKPHVHVVTWFYDHQPGMAIYTARLQALLKHARVTVVCRSAKDIERLGLPMACHVIPTRNEHYTDILLYAWRAAAYLRQQKAETVLLMTAQIAMAALWLPGRGVSLYWNEMPTHIFPPPRLNKIKAIGHAMLRWMTYRGALKVDTVMPISPFMQQDLIARGRAPDTTPVVPMGVYGAISQIRSGECPDVTAPLTLVYAGTLTNERSKLELMNGVLLALKNGQPVRLSLIGLTERDQDEWRQTFAKAGHPQALSVQGLLPHDQVLQQIAQADVAFAMLHPKPHFQYNPPIKIFEYLACGVPILYNDIRTLSHYLEHSCTGYCAELSAEGISRALTWMCAHRQEIAAWRAECRKAGEPYLWEQIEKLFVQSMPQPLGTNTQI